ncbi:MAG TPA: sigma factor, partial [Planctomycetota bacterium]|nr:sigma factor [Planctomycetota bacterium]
MDPLPERGQTPAERAGDWIERHAAAVRAAVFRHCPKSAGVDPEDLAQEVRIRLWRAVLAQPVIQNVPAFVRRVTLYAAADALRLARRPRPVSLERPGEEEGDARGTVAGREADPADAVA